MGKASNALEVLRKDHKAVQSLFHRFEGASGKEQDELCQKIIDELKTHTRIEEEVFYPWLREASNRLDLLEEASVEHKAAKDLIAELEQGGDGLHRQAVVKVLSEYVGHHIREEEDEIFPLVEQMGVDLDALGQELLERKQSES